MDRERLHRYRLIAVEIEQIKGFIHEMEARREEIWASATGVVGRGDGTPRAGGGDPDGKLVNYLSSSEALEKEREKLLACYRAKLKMLQEEQLAIERAVESLDEISRVVIRARYFEGLSWDETAKKYSSLHYCKRQLQRIQTEALDALERMGD